MDFSGLDILASKTDTLQDWPAFLGLLQNHWFSRTWTFAKAVYATKISVHLGGTVISWQDLSDASAIALSQLKKTIRRFGSRNGVDLPHPEILRAVSIFDARRVLRKNINNSHFSSQPCTLEKLVVDFAFLDASDPRDKIYSFIPLVNKT